MNQWALILTAAILGSGAAIARASEPEAASPAESNVRGAPSPNIGADRTIHFSLKAPEANSVQVAGGDGLGAGPFPMTKGADGVWSVTTPPAVPGDRKSTRLNSSHVSISYAVFCLKKKKYK